MDRVAMPQDGGVRFFVEGKVVAWQRAGHSGHHYTKDETRGWERVVSQIAALAMRGRPMLTGPLDLCVEVIIAVPQSYSKKKRTACLDGEVMPTARPDLDNYVKAIKDAMNNIVYKDDCLVVRALAIKRYGTRAGASINIKPYRNGDSNGERSVPLGGRHA